MYHPNDKIGPYTLVRRLGQGSFGIVWLAKDTSSIVREFVALKLPIGDEIDAEKMRQEAAFWLKASGHPNVLPVIDARIYDGQVAIVSEYMKDGTLGDRLERYEGRAPSVEWAVATTVGILKGLEHLHALNMVHRDLKPSNVLMDGDTPRLTDFGLTRILRNSTRNRSSDRAGTFPYTAPEMFRGSYSEQSDLWSTGVILYQMLMGALPFQAEHHAAIMYAICNSEPQPLPDTVPERVRAIVTCALDKDLSRRFATARIMRDALAPHPGSDLIEKPMLAMPMMEATLHISKSAPLVAEAAQRRAAQESAPLHSVDLDPATSMEIPSTSSLYENIAPRRVHSSQAPIKSAGKRRVAISLAAIAAVGAMSGGAAYLWWRPHRVTASSVQPDPTAITPRPGATETPPSINPHTIEGVAGAVSSPASSPGSRLPTPSRTDSNATMHDQSVKVPASTVNHETVDPKMANMSKTDNKPKSSHPGISHTFAHTSPAHTPVKHPVHTAVAVVHHRTHHDTNEDAAGTRTNKSRLTHHTRPPRATATTHTKTGPPKTAATKPPVSSGTGDIGR